jgi:hypothetical protein
MNEFLAENNIIDLDLKGDLSEELHFSKSLISLKFE